MRSKIAIGVVWALFTLPLRAEEAGGATPEAVFEKFQKALVEEKFQIACSQTTTDSQIAMIWDILALVHLSAGSSSTPGAVEEAAELNTVLKKHGAGLEAVLADDSKNSEDVISNVKDKPACLDECMICLKKWKEFNAILGKNNPIASAKIVDLKILENDASATLKLKRNGQVTTEGIKFKKVGGSWFIDSTPERRARAQGSQNQTTNNNDLKSSPKLPQPSH